MICDNPETVPMENQSVGFAVVLACDFDVTRRRHAKQSTPGYIYKPQIAVFVEGGPFEKTRRIGTPKQEFCPLGFTVLNAERGIYIDKDFGFDHRRSGKHVSVFAIWFEFGM